MRENTQRCDNAHLTGARKRERHRFLFDSYPSRCLCNAVKIAVLTFVNLRFILELISLLTKLEYMRSLVLSFYNILVDCVVMYY